MRLMIVIICLLSSLKLQSQDFEFTWSLYPSFCSSFRVEIVKNGLSNQISVSSADNLSSVTKPIKEKDCKNLISLLKSIDFRNTVKITDNQIVAGRIYFSYEKIDSTRIIIEGKPRSKSILGFYGYFYDVDSAKYYKEIIKENSIIWEGNVYRGKFVMNGKEKSFEIYSGFLNKTDYLLNRMMYRLISEYANESLTDCLSCTIRNDNPKKK